MKSSARDIYLKIEPIEDYSPVEPMEKAAPPIQYRRDCMRSSGHEDGTIPEAEVEARSLTALVYREYEDPGYLLPKVDKLIEEDVNEPVWSHRVPGAVLYVRVGERIRIHVLNCDVEPHSLHLHGLRYGIDSDGAWPFGTTSSDGRRSDEICPGQTWTYTFDVIEGTEGVWPFHDHAQKPRPSIDRGLFGLLIVQPKKDKPPKPRIPLPPDWLKHREKILKRGQPAPPGQVRLAPPKALEHAGQLNFLEEWLEKEFVLPREPHDDVIHAPAIFHRMVDDKAQPVFDSGDLEELVGVFENVFGEAGSFEYFCQFHPTMEGTVEVTPGGPALVTVNIVDGPPMGFSPATVTVGVGGTVRWENHSVQHHTVTSRDGAAVATHCINGRGFVGNSPTIVGRSGQKIRWYIANLDLGESWHNFHPHSSRWQLAGENLDVRGMSPAESFTVETEIPPVIVLSGEAERIQERKYRPKNAKPYRLKGDYVFHCHVHHHMMNGMIGLVRALQTVWLTPEMVEEIESQRGLPLDDGTNKCPDVDRNRCRKHGEGEWQEVPGDPEVTFMHSMPLPNTDQVLFWGYTRADQTRLWDMGTGVYSQPANQPADLPGHDPNSSNLWSAEHTFLDTPQGTLLVNGGLTLGGAQAFLFDPSTLTWAATGATVANRFYSTTLTLADGTAITLYGPTANDYEIYDPAAGAWAAPVAFPVGMEHHQYYPWTYLLPDGRLVIAGPHHPTHRIDLANPAGVETFPTVHGNRDTGGQKGTAVMLILRPPSYEPKVIILGGNTPTTEQTSEILDLSQPAPAWADLAPLNVARPQQLTATLLPDGRVFIAGGVLGGPDGGPSEIFDPQDPGAGWQLGPAMTYPRGYHSSFVLLPDGSVLGGGDPQVAGQPTPHERYFPGYTFQPRPVITAAPAEIHYGDAFTVDSPQAAVVSEVILMRPGAVTHGFNMSQRGVECVASPGGAGQIDATAPPNANIAPPGYYLLHLVDANRVPSEGRWIRLTA